MDDHIEVQQQFDLQDLNRQTKLIKGRDQNQNRGTLKKKGGIMSGLKSDDGTHPMNDTET